MHALHVHHGLRGAQADRDAEFCAQLCGEFDIPLQILHYDVPAMAAAKGLSFEHMGRELRRSALREYSRSIQEAYELAELPAIALAHHADDQAETVLFNLCRGGAGLRPIRSVNEVDGLYYLRPLLLWRRQEITHYLSSRSLPWCDDETNEEDDATRNALRHHIIPQLSDLMGRDVVPILNRSARLQLESTQALEAALSILPSRDPQGRLYLPFLRQQTAALQRAILFSYLREQQISDLSEKTMQKALELISGESHVLNLTNGARLHRRQGRLFVKFVD